MSQYKKVTTEKNFPIHKKMSQYINKFTIEKETTYFSSRGDSQRVGLIYEATLFSYVTHIV